MTHCPAIRLFLATLFVAHLGFAQKITTMLKDIDPGAADTYPQNMVNIGGTLFFTASAGSSGAELWKSDGTPGGTVLLKDINPGADGSNPGFLTAVNGILFLAASDPVYGGELWKSDGTPAGTVLVKDIVPGSGGSGVQNLTDVNGTLFFFAGDAAAGAELWKSDGTPSGTVLVKDINPGPGNSLPQSLTNVNGTLFFTADDGTDGVELWKSDGTPSGTVLVKDIYSGPQSSYPAHLTNVNGTLYFEALDSTLDDELWKSDGTPSGTVIVKDIWPGLNSSTPQNLIDVNGTLFFQASDGTNGAELWKSNGTALGTVMVKDIHPGATGSGLAWMTVVNGTLFFSADNGTNGSELWKSDGTTGGTVMVKDIAPGAGGSAPMSLAASRGTLFFSADDGVHGYELWKSDGTTSGTTIVGDLFAGANSSYPQSLTDVNGVLYFGASDGAHGVEPWTCYGIDDVGKILSVSDVPKDQGSNVRLSWRKSVWDTTDGSGHVTTYAVWRKIPPPLQAAGYAKARVPVTLSAASDSLSDYDCLMTVPAIRIATYNVVVPTLEDSSSSGTHRAIYLITAHTTDPNYFYVSAADSGYSVDNLAPVPPAGVVATAVPGPQVELSWNPASDPDVGRYDIYRSTASGFTPAPENFLGSSTASGYTDGSPAAGVDNYYRITAVDLHGNVSGPSAQATATVTVAQQLGMTGGWNMVSVPLVVSDFTATTLFPTATSPAFAFDASYEIRGTLDNGTGYWLKFAGAQTVPISGLVRTLDTVDVAAGWNLIGSLSSSIPTSGVVSVPGGIVTSPFYGYNGSYQAVTSLEPGHGYWLKSTQAGQLVLSSSGVLPASARIRMELQGETPPLPPGEESAGAGIPQTYDLAQNYPNPFNPATVIRYTLPAGGSVRLSVFNALGQEVATLVNGVEGAGYKSVSFNASNLPSGVYTYTLTAGTYRETRKMLLVR